MVVTKPVMLRGGTATGLRVQLPKTRILSIYTEKGYVMCGILNVPELDRIHPERKIVAVRCVGVSEIDDLLRARVVDATREAMSLGIREGMTGEEALEMML